MSDFCAYCHHHDKWSPEVVVVVIQFEGIKKEVPLIPDDSKPWHICLNSGCDFPFVFIDQAIAAAPVCAGKPPWSKAAIFTEGAVVLMIPAERRPKAHAGFTN